MIDIASGHSAIDRYLADGYGRVPGMSSRFAAAICGHLIRRQSEMGVVGALAEIGTFEGRFFIAMALGVARDRFVAWKADSREIGAAEFGSKLGQKPLRFVHIDSHHSRDCLSNDLELVHTLLHAQAIVCLDDMLHPGYTMMACAAF